MTSLVGAKTGDLVYLRKGDFILYGRVANDLHLARRDTINIRFDYPDAPWAIYHFPNSSDWDEAYVVERAKPEPPDGCVAALTNTGNLIVRDRKAGPDGWTHVDSDLTSTWLYFDKQVGPLTPLMPQENNADTPAGMDS